jgi:alanine dehydrogenase
MLNIDFANVHRLATVASLIEPMRQAFSTPTVSPQRAHYDLGTSSESRTLLIMPAWRQGGSIGVKITTVFPDNTARGLPSIAGAYILLSAGTGQALALIDARALTLLRTAAVSAMAADLLAPSNPKVLLMVGTGALSRYLIEGHVAVRQYQSILIWGRNPRKAQAVAEEFGARGCRIDVQTDLEHATRSADVISCATMSDSALIEGSWLKPGCHLDLVGSFKPTMREADDECLRGAFIAVDTLDALAESGDLIGPISRGIVERAQITTLKALLAGEAPLSTARHTVFKSVGVALADLAAAEHLFRSDG